MSYTPFVWLPLSAAFINAALGVLLAQYRDAPGIRQFQVLTWISAAWALLYGIGVNVSYFPAKLFILNLTYIPSALSAPAFFAFTLAYAGHKRWLTRRRAFFLLLPPLLFVLFAFSSQHHQLWRYDYRLVFHGSLSLLTSQKGIVYWLYVAYKAVLGLASLFVILIPFRHQPPYFRNTLILAAGLAFPLLVGLLYVLGLTPIRGFDWTPVSFIFTGGMYIWAISRSGLMRVAPIARSVFVDAIEDLMVAFNQDDLLVDFNRAAQTTIGLTSEAIGSPAASLPSPWGNIFAEHGETLSGKREVEIGGKMYHAVVSPIPGEGTIALGRMFLFHDITAQKQIEEKERKERTFAEALTDVAKALNGAFDYESLLQQILRNAQRVVPADAANIVLRDQNGRWRFAMFHGYEPFVPPGSELFKMSPDSFEQIRTVFSKGEPIVIPDVYADPSWIIHPGGEWIRSYAAIPIRMENQVVGVLNLDSAQSGLYAPEHIDVLRAFADQIAVAVKNAWLYEALERELAEKQSAEKRLKLANAQLETQLKQIQGLQLILREQAIRDPLTGLYNRRYLEEMIPRELARAKRKSYPVGFALIDLDHFKQLQPLNLFELRF